MQSPAGLLQSD